MPTLGFPSADPKIFLFDRASHCPDLCHWLPNLGREAALPVSKLIRNDLSIGIDLQAPPSALLITGGQLTLLNYLIQSEVGLITFLLFTSFESILETDYVFNTSPEISVAIGKCN